jgi:hypothetical protein
MRRTFCGVLRIAHFIVRWMNPRSIGSPIWRSTMQISSEALAPR